MGGELVFASAACFVLVSLSVLYRLLSHVLLGRGHGIYIPYWYCDRMRVTTLQCLYFNLGRLPKCPVNKLGMRSTAVDVQKAIFPKTKQIRDGASWGRAAEGRRKLDGGAELGSKLGDGHDACDGGGHGRGGRRA